MRGSCRRKSVALWLSAVCLVWLSAAPSIAASPTWIKARSGPFETVSDNGRRSATQALNQFEQFRFALGTVLGKADLRLDPAIRIILSRPGISGEGCQGIQRGIHMGRERLMVCTPAEAQLSPELIRSLTRILLEANFTALPPSMEKAVESFFSTIQSNATHVTWGAPPPQPERTRDWALLHRIVTQPDYAGKARIYLHNLAAGMDRRSAVKNAFGEDAATFEAETDKYYAAGVFNTASAPARPINPDRDFATTALTSDEGMLMSADLLDSGSEGLYKQLLTLGKQVTQANEGLGLLALRENDLPRARKYFQTALEAGSKNAVMMTAYAGAEEDPAKAVKILEKAVTADPGYAPAHWMWGEKSNDPRMRLKQWKEATALAPRNSEWWSRYAQFCVEQKQFAEAGRAWVAAAQAAPDEARRNEYLGARGRIDEQRLQADDEARRKEMEAQARELERLKTEARKEIATLESRANGDHVPSKDAAVVDWSDINGSTVTGTLESVECLGKQYRIHVNTPDGKSHVFSIRDLSKIEATGGRAKLPCGTVKSRPVTVMYKAAPSGQSEGEVLSLEFPRS